MPARKEHHQIGSWRQALLAEFSQRVSDQGVAPGMTCVRRRVRDDADNCARKRTTCGVDRRAFEGGCFLAEGVGGLQKQRQREEDCKEKGTGPKVQHETTLCRYGKHDHATIGADTVQR